LADVEGSGCESRRGRRRGAPSAHPSILGAGRRTPSRARRAKLIAAASKAKSCAMRSRPRTRARRPPCLRRIRCAILRSTLGRVARYRFFQSGSRCRRRDRSSVRCLGWTPTVRPLLLSVHWARRGQSLQSAPNCASPEPSLLRRSLTSCPAGHCTVPASRSMRKSSLGELAFARGGRLHFGVGVEAGRFELLDQVGGAVGRVAVHLHRVGGRRRAPRRLRCRRSPPWP